MTKQGKIARLRAGFQRLNEDNRERLGDLSRRLLSVQGSCGGKAGHVVRRDAGQTPMGQRAFSGVDAPVIAGREI